MSPTGPRYPTAAADGGGVNGAWTNTGNVFAEDGVYASGDISGGGSSTNNLNTSGYGFALPATAIIDGILVEFKRTGTTAATAGVGLIKGGVNQSGKLGFDFWPSTVNWVSYGGPSDLWGGVWTYSDINNSGFGAAIQAYNTHGGGDAFVDAVRITVFWHSAPAIIPKTKEYIYKVFDGQTNVYMGNLPSVSSIFGLSQDINTMAVQITIVCGVSADTSALPVDVLTDEAGNILTDENSVSLTNDGQLPPSGIGTSGALIRDGNRVEVWEYGYYHVNGICMFSGRIDRHSDNFGGDTGGDDISILVYSDSSDMNEYLIQKTPLATAAGGDPIDSQFLLNAAVPYPSLGQTIVPFFGSGLNRIRLNIAAIAANNPEVTVGLYAKSDGATNLANFNAGATPDETASKVITSTDAKDYDFVFQYNFPPTSSGYYVIAISCTDASGVNVSYRAASNDYPSGNMLTPGAVAQAINFVVFETIFETNPLYAFMDPSDMLLSFMINYGGAVQISDRTVDQTNLKLNYQLNTNTVLQGSTFIQTISPAGFYIYTDVGNNVLWFKRNNTIADFVLTKGVHLNKLTVVSTTEYVVNVCIVIGATVAGTQIYTYDEDLPSIARYGRRLRVYTDNSIPDIMTAHIIGRNIIDSFKDEQYQTVVTIVDGTMDTTLLTPGKVGGFNGFGTYVDYLLAQIVRREYEPDQVTLTFGLLPARTTTAVEQLTKGLLSQQTVQNPATPS